MKQVDYLNTLIDSLNELFFTYDTSARITMANKKSLEVLGLNPVEILGRDVHTLAVDEDQELIAREKRARLTEGLPGSYEVSVLHRDGSKRLLRLNSSPIEDNRIVGMDSGGDITERRRTEEALAAEKE